MNEPYDSVPPPAPPHSPITSAGPPAPWGPDAEAKPVGVAPAAPEAAAPEAAAPEAAAPEAAAPEAAASAPTGPGEEAKPASQDSPPPKALLEFMVRDWNPRSSALPAPIAHHEAFAARRRALSKLFPGEALVIPTGHEKVRANDTHYPFRPGSDFYYLTGCLEPDCVLVMQPEAGGGHRDVLFVEANPGRSDATFFTDRVKGDLWVGPRLGVPQSRARFAVHECRPLIELPSMLASFGNDAKAGEAAKASPRTARVLRGFSAKIDAALREHARDKDLAVALGELRLIKDAVEVAELRAAIDATKRGFEDVIRRLPKAKTEREVEGIFNLRARVEGNDVGYRTIAACGAHACVMHWSRNDGPIRRRALLLLDAGVEGESLYTADITRTLPVSGAFTKEQRIVYKLVYKAQKAALKHVRPGNDFMEPNRAAMRVLAEGLEELGVLPASAAESLKEEHQFYKRYSLHNVSHMLGLDVHDCAEARKEVYKFGKLRPGMVLTVEPGLYFQEDDLTVPERFRGVGVRIEDDILVTESGYENLSAHIPSRLGEVEDWIARLWKK
jgi:Xaa-Pro aminopeptidase